MLCGWLVRASFRASDTPPERQLKSIFVPWDGYPQTPFDLGLIVGALAMLAGGLGPSLFTHRPPHLVWQWVAAAST
eukprot:gene10708-1916_t